MALPAKRRRQDGPDSHVCRVRHPKLWLEDGDIILVCDYMGFCVARSILALHSPKFRNTFEFERHNEREPHESIPVVHLHDNAEDMESLLMAIHFRQYGQLKSEPCYDILARLLKMSTRYMVDSLREEVIDVLAIIFPSRLDKDYGKRYVPVDFDNSEKLRVVQLAKKANVPLILPHAYYLTCSLPLEKVTDFSLDDLDSENDEDSVSDQTRWDCVLFRHKFAKAVSEILEECNSSADSPWKLRTTNGRWTCGRDDCAGVRDAVKEETENAFRFPERHGGDIFDTIPFSGHDLCAACNKRMDKH